MSDQDQPKATCSEPTDTNGNLPDELAAILDMLPTDRIRYLIARVDCDTNKDAARMVGMTESTVKSWPKEQKDLLERARKLMAKDGVVTALHLRRRNLAKAMAVKVRGLDSGDERVRQGAATEIIEWEMGSAVQKIAPTDPTGEHEYGGIQDDLQRRLAGLSAAIGTAGVHKQSDGAGD